MDDEHHRYHKHTKFSQNLRGDPKFLVDLTQNDPNVYYSGCSKQCRNGTGNADVPTFQITLY